MARKLWHALPAAVACKPKTELPSRIGKPHDPTTIVRRANADNDARPQRKSMNAPLSAPASERFVDSQQSLRSPGRGLCRASCLAFADDQSRALATRPSWSCYPGAAHRPRGAPMNLWRSRAFPGGCVTVQEPYKTKSSRRAITEDWDAATRTVQQLWIRSEQTVSAIGGLRT